MYERTNYKRKEGKARFQNEVHATVNMEVLQYCKIMNLENLNHKSDA